MARPVERQMLWSALQVASSEGWGSLYSLLFSPHPLGWAGERLPFPVFRFPGRVGEASVTLSLRHSVTGWVGGCPYIFSSLAIVGTSVLRPARSK